MTPHCFLFLFVALEPSLTMYAMKVALDQAHTTRSQGQDRAAQTVQPGPQGLKKTPRPKLHATTGLSRNTKHSGEKCQCQLPMQPLPNCPRVWTPASPPMLGNANEPDAYLRGKGLLERHPLGLCVAVKKEAPRTWARHWCTALASQRRGCQCNIRLIASSVHVCLETKKWRLPTRGEVSVLFAREGGEQVKHLRKRVSEAPLKEDGC